MQTVRIRNVPQQNGADMIIGLKKETPAIATMKGNQVTELRESPLKFKVFLEIVTELACISVLN